jgi:hypothetical protein
MGCDAWLDDLSPQRADPAQGVRFIFGNETRVTHDIGDHDGSQPPLGTGAPAEYGCIYSPLHRVAPPVSRVAFRTVNAGPCAYGT